MPNVHEICTALFDAAPAYMKMDWDNVGLMCGHPERAVTRVMVALDASMDTLTEAKIQHAFDELAKNRTTLIIAHRLSTIRAAGEIVVIADGRIAERGTNEELLKKDGIYASLCRTQNLLA